jgi:hypothetical protein
VQAGLIAAWTTVDEAESLEEMRMFHCNLHVANRSDLPVMRLIVNAVPAPSLGDLLQPTSLHRRTLGPAESETVRIGTTDAHDALGYPGRVLSVEFTDHAGIRWRRDDSGLAEMKPGK